MTVGRWPVIFDDAGKKQAFGARLTANGNGMMPDTGCWIEELIELIRSLKVISLLSMQKKLAKDIVTHK
jgi:hypothetical protein